MSRDSEGDNLNRGRLIESALKLLDTKTLSQINYREIAAGAGLSHMTAYRHFKTLEDLLEAVAEEGYKKLTRDLHTVVEQYHATPKALLEKAFLAYFRFAHSHPHHLTAMFDRGDQKGKFKRTSFLKATQSLLEEYLGIIRISQNAGIFPHGWSANELGMMLWSFSHGYAILETKAELKLVMQSRPNSEEFVRKGASVFIAGLNELLRSAEKKE